MGGGGVERRAPLAIAAVERQLRVNSSQSHAATAAAPHAAAWCSKPRPRAVSIGVQPSVSSVLVTGRLSAPTARKSGVHPELVVAETLCSAPSSPPIRSNGGASGGDGASAARWMSWRPSALTAGSARASSSARAAAARPPITASCSAVYGGFFGGGAVDVDARAQQLVDDVALAAPRRPLERAEAGGVAVRRRRRRAE